MMRFQLTLSVFLIGLNLLSGWFLPAAKDSEAIMETMDLENDLYEWVKRKVDEGALSESELDRLFPERKYSGFERSSDGKGFSGIIMTYQDNVERDMRVLGYIVIGVALTLGLIEGFRILKARRRRDATKQVDAG